MMLLLLLSADLVVDKEKRTIIVPAKVAPRKLDDPAYKGETYPVEVVATFPHPKGKKAHETVLTFDAKPSEIHKALVDLGLKPGTPAKTADDTQSGPEVKLFIEKVPGKPGSRVAVEKCLTDRKSGKPMPKVKWLFTGSAMSKPDPDKPEVYGADASGTLAAVFPVTAETVFQSSLSLKDEKYVKLEVVPDALPKVGTAVNLVIVVPAK
ncbi:MAG: YdjY domain-containing protein [Gemmataceae bacterium]|nr:YdjY domain-containing protein [Gemmataceae bacterium]